MTTATATIAVNPVNDPPAAAADAFVVDEDGILELPASAGVLANDSDADGDTLTSVQVTAPAHGRLSLNQDGSLSYTPYSDFAGEDVFTYRATDRLVSSDLAVVRIAVRGVNDVPVVSVGSRGTAAEGSAFTRSGSFADPDANDAWQATIDWGEGSGELPLPLNADKTFNLQHRFRDDGEYTVTVSVRDRLGGIGRNSFRVNVANVSPTAVITSGPQGGVPFQPLRFEGSFTDAGTADSHDMTWQVVNASGALVAAGGGSSFSFTPTVVGTQTLRFTVTDDDGGTSTVTRALSIGLVQLQDDPCEPGLKVLVVGGTPGHDGIYLAPSLVPRGQVSIWYGGVSISGSEPTTTLLPIGPKLLGTFPLPDKFILYGGDGWDALIVDPRLKVPAVMFGGAGNDALRGGSGDDILIGGAGHDLLSGGAGRDLLIGGASSDVIDAHEGDDILIGGSTAYDNDLCALGAIMKEWVRTDQTYAQRVGHLTGALAGGRNGSYLFSTSTLFEDAATDVLVGHGGADWFIARLGQADRNRDRVIDLTAGERQDDCR
jgi:VCBS repeat-containing protein